MTPSVPPSSVPPGRDVHHATGWAVAAAILCWPLGVPALLGAQRAARAIGSGDLAAATTHARAARRFGIAAVVVSAAGCARRGSWPSSSVSWPAR
ncbi:CD225/dispanin family protein [Isoptericola nanjingensis]|uniref:CD225/dispanin family protein n=1 Tax=Isoptericola nanjingensis TaxID=903413 RepID=UPI003D1D1201